MDLCDCTCDYFDKIVYWSNFTQKIIGFCFLKILWILKWSIFFLIVVDLCDCTCDYFDKIGYWSNFTNHVAQYQELSKTLAEIRQQLAVETRNLSSFLNSKRSATDSRQSAAVTGILGASCIILISSAFILMDISRLFMHDRNKWWWNWRTNGFNFAPTFACFVNSVAVIFF